MPRRWVPVHEDIKVPVLKNIWYASKIMHKCSKSIMPAAIIEQIAFSVFTQFIQGVLFLKVLLNIIEGNCTFEYFVKALIIFLAVSLANEIITIICDYTQLVSQKKVFKNLNNLIFEKAASVDVSCYEDPAFYDSYKRATEILTGGYFLAFCVDFANVIGAFISFFLVVGVVISIDPVYLFFLAPVLLVFVVQLIKSKLFYKRDLQMTTNNRIKAYTQRTVFLKDFSKDMRTSNIFAVMFNRFNKAVESNIRIIKSYGLKLFLYSMIGSIFGEFIPIVGTYAFASYQFINNSGLNISGFSVVLSSINSIRSSTTAIADSFSELSNMALYFQNLHDFFDYESSVKSGALEADEFKSLEFKNVSFKYPSAETYSLNNVNLKINKGETTALVGVNGAGKTTFVKLLLRFYDATEGKILYNGINIKEYNLDSLRARFATVFQDYKTFALSVNENVICHDCSSEEKELAEQALKQSGVWDKIQTLPKGADTVLTREFDDKGAGLSGGEAQKTAVARMFAREFDIAILDEPSSALDPIAEYNMYENLIKATENKTVLYISHRLSSAVLSDKIFVLGGGTVLESGSHNELMELGGEYSKMFTLQASSYSREEADDLA
ncbi:MAG: ABC transporter ATP-binding protein [Eubacterium sp.]